MLQGAVRLSPVAPVTRLLAAALALTATAAGASALPAPAFQPDVRVDLAGWRITGMPDLDQLRGASSTRENLPEQGLNYCGPTASANLLAVLNRSGHADAVVDGGIDWQSNDNYDVAVRAIRQVGDDMRTTADGGTDLNDIISGINGHLTSEATLGGTRVNSRRAWTSSAPDAGDLVELGLNGAIPMVFWGRYSSTTSASETVTWTRTGGHIVSLVGATANPSGELGTIRVHDPWTSSTYDTVQSPFTADPQDLREPARMRLSDGSSYTVTPYGSSTRTFLEGYVAVYPETLYVWRPSPGGGGGIIRFRELPLLEDDPVRDVLTVSGGVTDVVIGPTGTPFVLRPGGQVVRMGAGVAGARTAPTTVGRAPGARRIAVTPDGTVLAAGSGRLHYMRRGAKPVVRAIPAGGVDDIAFDQMSGRARILIDGRRVIAVGATGAIATTTLARRATVLNVSSRSVRAGRQGTAAMGAALRIGADRRARIGSRVVTGPLPRGSRIIGTWQMPVLRDEPGQPGIADGGKARDDIPAGPRANLVAAPGPQPGTVLVRNTGPVTAQPSVLEVVWQGGRRTEDIPSLGPGASSAAIAVTCEGQMTATADAKGQVAESEEQDNTVMVACT